DGIRDFHVTGVQTCALPICENYPDVPTVEFDLYSACVEALINGDVDAVTTDQAILIGYAALYSGEIKVVGEPFTEERYGVGLPRSEERRAGKGGRSRGWRWH